MKRSEYELKMKALQDEIEALKKVEIEEDSGRWKPEMRDEYYYIEENGSIDSYRWDNYGYDNEHYKIGNCFKTREEAEFVVERFKVLAELKEFAEPFDTEWDCADTQGVDKHWFIGYNYGISHLYVDSRMTYRRAELYFASEEDAKKAIEAVGEDRIKEYYLGVVE